MGKPKPIPVPLETDPIAKPQEARHSQAEINSRAMSLYSVRYDLKPNEMGILNRQATRFFAECLKQASEEMGPAIEFSGGGEIKPAEVSSEVQALIDRLALLRASPLERAKLTFSKG